MLNEHAISVANTYWATHLGGSLPALFTEPCVIFTHGPALADYCGVFALFRGGAVAISIPSDHAGALRELLSAQSHGWSPASFASALASVAVAIIGPAYIGYAPVVSPPAHPARALSPSDALARRTLQQSCDATDWEYGGSAVERPSSGVFDSGRLVALAGYEVWGGAIAHISVVTHPHFRSRGFGRSAVAHLAGRAIAAGLLPQYRTLESNAPSMRVAELLGFHAYARSMAIRLNRNA